MRDDRGWVLSVAHFDVVRMARLAASDRARAPRRRRVAHVVPTTDAAIVAFAVDALRADYRRMPDPAALLDEPFTMRELRAVHESIAGEPAAATFSCA